MNPPTLNEEIEKAGVLEAYLQGFIRGMAEGQFIREKAYLVCRLKERFGDVPAELLMRIGAASADQTYDWHYRVDQAASVDAVFNPD
jgi:hypothetical protein